MSNWIAALHVVFAAAALLLGSGIFIARRGTPMHRKLGYACITSMLTLNVSALLLYSRTGDFGPFHVAALISLATLLAGAVAEPAFRIPGLAYWPAIVTASLLTILTGGVLIYRSKGAMRQFISTRQAASPDV